MASPTAEYEPNTNKSKREKHKIGEIPMFPAQQDMIEEVLPETPKVKNPKR